MIFKIPSASLCDVLTLCFSVETEEKGKSDRLSFEEVVSHVSHGNLDRLSSKHNKDGCVGLWAEEQQLDKIELENGDTVRLKTKGDCPLLCELFNL